MPRVLWFFRNNYLRSDVFFAVGSLLLVVYVVDAYDRVFLPEGTQVCLDYTFSHTLLLDRVHLYLFRVFCFFCNAKQSL